MMPAGPAASAPREGIAATAAPAGERRHVATVGAVALAVLAAWAALDLVHGAVLGRGTADGLEGMLCLAVPRGAGEGAGLATATAIAAGVWALMAAAMMLPTALPAVELYSRLTRRLDAGRALHVVAFVAGYLLAWSGFAVLVGAGGALAAAALRAPLAAVPSALIAAVLLALAGAYQLTSLKAACLRLCRSPLGFFMRHWRDGPRGALGLGLRHGIICIGCCWALMLLMFVAGTADLVWMAGLGLLMLAEKSLPGAERWSRLLGLGMIGAAGALAVHAAL